jgi:hypothetical protein
MKRSGHHVITNWIEAHTKQKFYNNCCFGWEGKKLLTMRGKYEAVCGIANIEDFNFESWEAFDFPSFPFVQDCKVIVVVRTLNNWLASCYARKFQNNRERKDVCKYLRTPYINDSKLKSPSRIDLYCKHLEFIHSNKNIIGVTFDHFIQTRGVRIKLADELGFKWNEKADMAVKNLSKYGGGSSFRSNETNVFNRDKLFRHDAEFKELSKFASEKAIKTMQMIGRY